MKLTIEVPEQAYETLAMLTEGHGVSPGQLAVGFLLAGISGASVLQAAGFHLSGEQGLEHYFAALDAANRD